MDPIDAGIDSALLIEAEIETLMMRLHDVDPNAYLRLQKLMDRFRRQHTFEQWMN